MYIVAQVDFGDRVENVWADIIEWTPRLLGFLLILVLGWLVARFLEKAVDKVLEKVGFDRWVSRGGIDRAMRDVPYDPSSLVGRLVFFSVFLFALQLAFGVFGPNPISDLITGVIAYLPNILVAIVIIVVAAFIANAVRQIVASALGRLSYGRALATGSYVAILVIGIFAALDQLRLAENIVTGLFYAILAVIVGVAIVAVGGGGIAPMRERWERALASVDREAPRIAEQTRQERPDTVSGFEPETLR